VDYTGYAHPIVHSLVAPARFEVFVADLWNAPSLEAMLQI